MENKLFYCYFETDITFLPGNIQPYSSMLCCNRLAGKNGRKIDLVNQNVINIKEKMYTAYETVTFPRRLSQETLMKQRLYYSADVLCRLALLSLLFIKHFKM